MEEEVKFCTNCKRDISVKNFVIHSVHCERNIQLCNRCFEPVPRSEFEKHEEEFHSQETCSDCNIAVERWQIEKHKETCTKKLVSCEYCDLVVHLDTLLEHMGVCGCRTEQCPSCKKHVMIKDLKEHPTKCLSGEPEMVQCEYCGLQIEIRIFEGHIAMCGTRTERCLLCNQHVMVQDRDTHFLICQKRLNSHEFITCDYCGGTFRQNDIQRHIEICVLQKVKCNNCNLYISRNDMELHLAMCKQKQPLKLMFPCKYCKDFFSRDCLEDHTLFCGFQTRKCEKCNKDIELKNLESHSNVCQESISKNYGECPVCRQSISWVDMNVHFTACSRMHYESDDYELQNKFNEHALRKEFESSADPSSKEKKIQLKKETKHCSFCFKMFPIDNFTEHLKDCLERPYNCETCLKPMAYRKKEEHVQYCHYQQIEENHENAYIQQYEETDNNELKRLKKCPFCDEKLTDVLFHHHTKECEHRKEKCNNCAENVSIKDMQNHQLQECIFAHNERNKTFISHNSVYSESASAFPKNTGNTGELEKNVEVCPRCKCKIPVERFSNHLKLCYEGKTLCKFCNIEIMKHSEHGHLKNCPVILENIEQENKFQSKKKRGATAEGKPTKKWNFLGNVASFLSNKNKSFEENNSNIVYGKSRFSQFDQEHNYEKGHMAPIQQPPTVYNELPCEFCNEMWPFELIIEHQSGCRPDLVSFPKKESEDQKFGVAAASEISHTSVLNSSSKSTEEDDNGWKVKSRRNKQSSYKKSNEYCIKEKNVPQKPQLTEKEKFFYYQPKDSEEVPKNDFNSSHKKRYPQLKESSEISKKEHTKLRESPEISNNYHAQPKKSPEISKKCYSQCREIPETLKKTSDKKLKEKDAGSEIKRADTKKDQFTSFKFSTSEFNIESNHDSNSWKENVDTSITDAEVHDKMEKNDSCIQAEELYAGLGSVKSNYIGENKAVGAERTERRRLINSKKDFDEDISFVKKDCERLSVEKLNVDVSTTDPKMHDEKKKNNSYKQSTELYVGLDSIKSDFDREKKVVGAERIERMRFMHSRKDFDEDVSFVKKDCEELFPKNLIDENNKRVELLEFLETSESTALNLNMPGIWKTDFNSSRNGNFNNLLESCSSNYDKDKATNLSNAVTDIEPSILNSNVHDTDYDKKNEETFGTDFVVSINNNQKKEYENDTHSNSDDTFYDADDDDSKFNTNLYFNSTSPEKKLNLYDFDNLNFSNTLQRNNLSHGNYEDLNAAVRPKNEDLNRKDSDLNACYEFLFQNFGQTDKAFSYKNAENCTKCDKKECSCETYSALQKGYLKTCSFKDVSSNKNHSEPMEVEQFVAGTKASSTVKSEKSLLKISNEKEVDKSFAIDEGFKWRKWRSLQTSDSE